MILYCDDREKNCSSKFLTKSIIKPISSSVFHFKLYLVLLIGWRSVGRYLQSLPCQSDEMAIPRKIRFCPLPALFIASASGVVVCAN